MLDAHCDARRLIGKVQARSDRELRDAAVAVLHLGGDDALSEYLLTSMSTLIAVAILERGGEAACELMAAGLETAERLNSAGA